MANYVIQRKNSDRERPGSAVCTHASINLTATTSINLKEKIKSMHFKIIVSAKSVQISARRGINMDLRCGTEYEGALPARSGYVLKLARRRNGRSITASVIIVKLMQMIRVSRTSDRVVSVGRTGSVT